MRVVVKLVVGALVAAMLMVSPVPAGAVTASPSGLSAVGAATTWQLSWDAVPGASAYKVDISTSANFSVLLESANTYARTHTPRIDLRAGSDRALYWRVAAYSNGTSASSLSPYSEVATVEVPTVGTPALTTPQDDATINYPAPVSFAWEPVPGAVSYEVEYTGPSGTPVSATVTSTVFSPSTALTRGAYSWRVRATTFSASTESNTTAWSARGSFSVAWRDADSRVQLLSPVTVLPAVSDPEFRWREVPGASYYKIAIYGDEAKTNVFQAPTEVYGTSFVPAKVMLNGPYYWEVTAYDTLGVAGAPQSSLTQFTKRWGGQAGATQASSESVDAAPLPLKRGTTVPLASHEGTLDNPERVPFDEFELSWTPIPRATFYRVTATPLGGGAAWACNTASTSITGSMSYGTGAQLATHSAGSSHCRGSGDNANRVVVGKTYMWQVQGIDYNADQGTLITAGMPTGTVVSGLSEPKYVMVENPSKAATVGPDCTEVTKIGGCVELDEEAFTEQEGMTRSASGVLEIRSPSPRLEWAPLEDAIGYEVRIYRGAGTTTHVATFRTAQTVLYPNGVFKDDNTGEPYSFRVRAILAGDLATGAGIVHPVEPTWDQTEHLEWKHTSAQAQFEQEHALERDGAVLLRWKPQFSVDELFGGNRGYQLSYAVASSGNWTNVRSEYPFWVARSGSTPLPAGTYDVKVAPLDANGDVGRATEVRQFTVAPQTPPSVTATATGAQSVLLKWAPSAVAEGYQVRWKSRDTATWTTVSSGNNLSSAQTAFAVSGLRPSDYDFSVRARTKGNNWSAWSDSVGARLAAATPSPVSADGAVFDGNSRIVEWKPVAGASRYAVQVATTEAGVDSAATTEVVGTKMSIPTDLAWTTRYYWRVTALAEPKLNTSAPTSSFTNRIALGSSPVRSFFARTRPAVPALSSTVTVVDADALNLSWSPLTGPDAGSDLAPTYVLRHRMTNRVPEDSWTETKVNASTNVTVTGLAPSTEYEFQISAFNTEGQSAWSTSRKKTTPTPPSAPTSPKAASRKAHSIDLQWGNPRSDGGAAVTGYTVRWRKAGETSWTSKRATASPTTLTGLAESTQYTIEVLALNGAGESAPATINVSTLALPGAPGAVKTSPGNKSVALSWAAPASDGGQKITGYQVWARPANGVWSSVGSSTSTSFKHTGVQNGKKYEYRVAAVTAAGVGPYSRSGSQVAGVPGKPKVSVTSKRGRFSIRGVAGASNGAKISSFSVQVSSNKKSWKTIKKTKKVVTYKKGKKGKTFYFRVVAKNKFGSSVPSTVKAAKKK